MGWVWRFSVIAAISIVTATMLAVSVWAQSSAVDGAVQAADAGEDIGRLLFILTFPAAGVAYSASGWVGKIRRSLSGIDTPPLEWRKMGKAVVLGCLLGTVAYFYVLYDADSGLAAITDERAFVAQVMANTGAIVFADKLLLGRGRAEDAGSKDTDEIPTSSPSEASGLDVIGELGDIQNEEAPPPARQVLK